MLILDNEMSKLQTPHFSEVDTLREIRPCQPPPN